MARAVPIPAALWRRLAALDGRCDLELRRVTTALAGAQCASRRNYPRMWVVRISERRAARAIIVEAASLLQALRKAVAIAEAHGWSAPP